MKINTNDLISITEANQNFSKVVRKVDENGVVVILKNNVPRYVITEFSEFQGEELAADEDVKNIAQRIIINNKRSFEELAK